LLKLSRSPAATPALEQRVGATPTLVPTTELPPPSASSSAGRDADRSTFEATSVAVLAPSVVAREGRTTPLDVRTATSVPSAKRRNEMLRAIDAGDVDALAQLAPTALELGDDESGLTLLHVGSFDGKAEMIDALVGLGAPIEARDPEGRTPLFYAARSGNLSALQALLKNSARIDARDRQNQTALDAASTSAVAARLVVEGASLGGDPAVSLRASLQAMGVRVESIADTRVKRQVAVEAAQARDHATLQQVGVIARADARVLRAALAQDDPVAAHAAARALQKQHGDDALVEVLARENHRRGGALLSDAILMASRSNEGGRAWALADLIVRSDVVDVHARVQQHAPLFLVAALHDVPPPFVEALLEAGADVEARGKAGVTARQIAHYFGNRGVADRLARVPRAGFAKWFAPHDPADPVELWLAVDSAFAQQKIRRVPMPAHYVSRLQERTPAELVASTPPGVSMFAQVARLDFDVREALDESRAVIREALWTRGDARGIAKSALLDVSARLLERYADHASGSEEEIERAVHAATADALFANGLGVALVRAPRSGPGPVPRATLLSVEAAALQVAAGVEAAVDDVERAALSTRFAPLIEQLREAGRTAQPTRLVDALCAAFAASALRPDSTADDALPIFESLLAASAPAALSAVVELAAEVVPDDDLRAMRAYALTSAQIALEAIRRAHPTG
jgi:ankyrin repeat protein